MLIHEEKRLAFCFHWHTASRATLPPLLRRGFVFAGRKHEGPLNLTGRTRHRFQGIDHYHYACTVRNHFDVFVSWLHAAKVLGQEEDKVTVEFIKSFHARRPNHFPYHHRLWRFLWDADPSQILYFEDIAAHLNKYLTGHGFQPLQEGEFEVKGRNPYRPRDSYRHHWRKDAVAYMEARFEDELEYLGYRF